MSNTITIPNNINVQIISTLTDFAGPVNGCTEWGATFVSATAGGYMSNTQVTGKSPVSGTPYFGSPIASCGFPSTSSGGLTMTFYPNSFVGTCTFYESVYDDAGNAIVSNTLSYYTQAPGALSVYAGPDANIVTDYTTIAGATFSGGVGPYTLLWTVDTLPPGAPTPIFLDDTVLAPTISNLTVNGDYTFELGVDPVVGSTVYDQIKITRTGAPAAAIIDWMFDVFQGTGYLKIYVNGTLTVNSSNTPTGIYVPTGTINSVPNGATITIDCHKFKNTPGLDNEASISVVSIPVSGGGSTPVASDFDSVYNGPADATVTFTFNAANNYYVTANVTDY